ncbi:glycerate kinase [Oerskovia sp. Sa1BUA8]|uniref:Glycerate kinase n=1 Tax=Oerskovia douganii TaxID=2762210 RepID=A0A9D5Z1F2_9CELL|nr:glycerate kinase [Oerskovia douganii]MBE7702219.1 glycerate kinase [Oerskovia douganii]
MRLLLAAAEPLVLTDGILSAEDACTLVAGTWAATVGGDVDPCVLNPGASGLLRALDAHAREQVAAIARDTRGHDLPVTLRLGPASATGARTAYVEAALLRRTPPGADDEGGDLGAATSYGVGQVVALAARLASRVVVATGDGGTHDAGAGLLAALAGSGAGPLTRGGAALGSVTGEDAATVLRAREALRTVELVGAVESDLPLLGLHGASGALASAEPALAGLAQELERAHGHFARQVTRALDGAGRRDLLAGLPGPTTALAPGVPRTTVAARAAADRALTGLPGAGAGGGLGFGIAALGGRLLPGTALVADLVGLDARTRGADVAVVVVDRLDATSTHDGALPEVARRAAAHGVPVVVLAREVLAGRREQAAAGISGAYELGADEGAARARVARVARTWAGIES